MNNLTTIYAHDNPFAHTSLQVWQHEWPHTWDNSSQERATEQLKDILGHQFSIDDRPSLSLFETEDDITLIDLDFAIVKSETL